MVAIVPTLRRLLWNGRERRPRTPWRLGLGLVVLAAVGLAGGIAGSVLSELAGEASPSAVAAAVGTAGAVTSYAALTAGLLVAGRLVDRRRLRDFGLSTSRPWRVDLGFGLALGTAMPALVFGLGLAAGFVSVTGTVVTRADPFLPVASDVPFALALALTFAYFVGVGVFEELLFRGYLLTNVAEGLRELPGFDPRRALVAATALTSVLFGLVHGTNPNATPLAVAIITVYGVFLAAGYVLTTRLAAPIGLHIAWNFAISSVFGFPVSGITTPVTVIAVAVSGPALVTGGAFGPEGGLIALAVLLVGIALLVAWVRRRAGGVTIRSAVAEPDLRIERKVLREDDESAGTGSNREAVSGPTDDGPPPDVSTPGESDGTSNHDG